MIFSTIKQSVKRAVKSCAAKAGYRIVPRNRDPQSLRLWLLKKPIRNIVDVGASTGETCAEWLQLFPAATVHAIEPLPTSFAVLKELQAKNSQRLRIHNFAIGSELGTVKFRFHPLHNTSSSLLARTEFSAQHLPETRDEVVIEVAMTTLDDLLSETMSSMRGEILVKLDVQGVEVAVIQGAERFLKHVKYLMTEVSLAPVYDGQSDFNAVHAAMVRAGFSLGGFLEQVHLDGLAPLYADILYVNQDL